MNKRNTISRFLFPAAVIVLFLSLTVLSRPLPNNGTDLPGNGSNGGFSLTPQPVTVDQITHNKGNIVTTIDNWGYIGGYGFYELPSGEWPRNSGHDYIGEIKYWMGATMPNGDTLVANSYDDFQALPSMINGAEEFKILLSTDTSRYYNYDLTDTVGLGVNNPANGWRIWDAQLNQWTYNSNYNVLSSNFTPGGPTSLQESHYRFGDLAEGNLLGLEITHTLLQWNYCYNEDFLFVILEITNTSANDYADFAFGLYIDIDVGGPDGTGENGRLEDVVAYDTAQNLAWTYDNVGRDPGWNAKTGVMGTKYIETPDNIGMTAFRSDDWAVITGIDDPGRYALINSTQFDASLPPTDQFYIQCTRGINLTAGKTVRVVYAIIAGDDEADFRANADLAQQLYDNFYIGPQPPPTPILQVTAGDEKVYLRWNDTSETSVDPLTLTNDFSGYKLYRSDNQGLTWGEPNYQTGNNCLTLDYSTLASFSVTSPGDPIARSFVDTGLYNGVEYWYCLAAVDIGDAGTGVDPLQSGFGIAGEVPNIVAVTPRTDPTGFFDAAGTVIHDYTGNGQASDGNVVPIVFDQSELLGSDYAVVFEDSASNTYWHLLNITNGDTVLAYQTNSGGDPNQFEVAEGLRVVLTNGDRNPRSYGQTAFSVIDTSMAIETFYGPSIPYWTWDESDVYGDAPYRSTFELRYTGDSTLASWVLDGFYGSDNTFWVGLEAWNITTNQRVSLAIYDIANDGVWDPGDPLTIVDYPYDSTATVTTAAFPEYYSWMFDLDAANYSPTAGDIFTIEGAPLNGPDDRFSFKIDGVDAVQAKAKLKDIRVVPNPYFATYSPMVETSQGESVLQFQQVPGNCTIRIYTMAGSLVATIDNSDGDGTAEWNLLTAEGRLISSGVYIFHVESDIGDHVGRFAVIK